MVQFVKMHVVICLIVLLASCCCSINASTVEEQLLQLQDGFDKMREILEEKNSRMEAQLAAQVVRLERVENQNKILTEEIARLNEMRKTRVLNRANGISNQPSTNAINQMPTSCEDLSEIGHTLNGLYSVMGMKSVESVYCDFSNATSDTGYQTWIGHVDVKSSPAYFFVLRDQIFNETRTPIPFDIVQLNVGAAYDKNSGVFTAPVTGKYYFTVSGMAAFPGTYITTRLFFQIGLYKNNEAMAFAMADNVSDYYENESFSFQSTLELIKGDQISVQIYGMSQAASLMTGTYTQFNGFLLEEDITQYLYML